MIGGSSVIAIIEKPQALEIIAGIIELSDGIIHRG
jgi:pyruvate kinase